MAAIAAVGTALAIGAVARRGALRFDTAVGVLFAGMFAFGIVLFSTIKGYVADLFSYLLGNVLGITTADIVQIAFLGGIVLVIVAVLRKELLYASFDPAGAAASGLPVVTLDYLLLGLIGVTIVVSIQAVGIIMVVAMLVTPAATGQLLVDKFWDLVKIAIARRRRGRGRRALPELLSQRRLGRLDRPGRDAVLRAGPAVLARSRAGSRGGDGVARRPARLDRRALRSRSGGCRLVRDDRSTGRTFAASSSIGLILLGLVRRRTSGRPSTSPNAAIEAYSRAHRSITFPRG